jgi:hypothetical protein
MTLNNRVGLLIPQAPNAGKTGSFYLLPEPLSVSLSVLTKAASAHRLQISRRYRPEMGALRLKRGATQLEMCGKTTES